MRDALPGKSSINTTVAFTKVALRLLKVDELADAIGDLTGVGQKKIESLVRKAETEIDKRNSAEFVAVAMADREWAEGVVSRSYIRLANDPARDIMSESLVGVDAVVQLASKAMNAVDQKDVRTASDDIKAYMTALSRAVAQWICAWYSSNPEPNLPAMSKVAGETLQAVRELPHQINTMGDHLGTLISSVHSQAEQPEKDELSPSVEAELIVFELDGQLECQANYAELAELVSAATIAVIESRPISIVVKAQAYDETLDKVTDAVYRAQLRRRLHQKLKWFRDVLSAFFSAQAEVAWSPYLATVDQRVSLVRSVFANQYASGEKLDVWRTAEPNASAPVWLSSDEVQAVVQSTRVGHWDHLRMGAGWRAADELPDHVIREKVIVSILAELVRQGITLQNGWPASVLFLRQWHIGQG